jgi:TRAP transporter TAXI family solute receptor
MKKRISHFCLALTFAISFFAGANAPAFAADKFITIGTGGLTGVYYPAGGAICRLVNRGRREHGIRCAVESTGGSIYNLNSLREGDLDISVTQSDWQFHAYRGTGPFRPVGPDKKLRSLFSLHSEPFTVIARKDSGINTFADLKGKRVNIGNPGSGMYATMKVIMKRMKWTESTFAVASKLKASEQAQALCDNDIDVMIYAAGHPNGAVQEATTICETKLIPVDGPVINKLVERYPFYAYTNIPGGMYQGNPEDVKTFGVKATFVTSSDVDQEVIFRVMKSIFDNFENFKTLHPVFSTLYTANLILEGNTAPLHKGAERFFIEKGYVTREQLDAAYAERESYFHQKKKPAVKPVVVPAQ